MYWQCRGRTNPCRECEAWRWEEKKQKEEQRKQRDAEATELCTSLLRLQRGVRSVSDRRARGTASAEGLPAPAAAALAGFERAAAADWLAPATLASALAGVPEARAAYEAAQKAVAEAGPGSTAGEAVRRRDEARDSFREALEAAAR